MGFWLFTTIFYCYITILCLYLYICMSKCIYVSVNLYCCAGPPGKQPLAEGGYPVEIKVNNNNKRGGKSLIKRNPAQILKKEVVKSIKTFRNGKTAGPDNLTVEMTEWLDLFGINMATDCLNVMHNDADILIDCLAKVTECEWHGRIKYTISFISNIEQK